MQMEDAIAKHRARRLADKNAIMTMVLREVGTQQRIRPTSSSPVFVIDPTKDRCLHYEEIRHRRRANSTSSSTAAIPSSSYLTIDPEILATHSEIDIRHDLLDCGIDICTPEVLGLWADSFDYQTPRTQFLYGVLKDYELNGSTIHTYVTKSNYATRVRSLRAYDAVSTDVMLRWTYPFCPETNILPDHSYTLKRGNVYQEQGVVCARSSNVGRRTILGEGTTVGEGAIVKNSVLGRRCRIGKNAVLDNVYAWDDVTVGEASEIRRAVLANDTVVGDKCRVEPGSLLSYGVKIADGVTVLEGTRVTRAERDGVAVPTDTEIVGAGGEGYAFVPEEEEDEEDETESVSSGLGMHKIFSTVMVYLLMHYLLPVYNMAELSLSSESISTLSSETSGFDEDGERSRSGSFSSSVSEDDDKGNFHQDAATSVYDGLVDNLSADVVQLELVGLRMSANASEHQVRRAVVEAFMRRVQQMVESESVGASEAVKKILTKYREILDRIIFDHSIDEKTDQVDLLLLFQQDLAARNKGENILLFVAKELYDLEIVEEEAYDQWWNNERSVASEELKRVRSQTKQFVDWLASAESDSEEEDEDDDDDDDDESE